MAQLIKNARQARGWSQAALAARAGVSAGWVGGVEKGTIRPTRRPSTDGSGPGALDRVARELDIDLSSVLVDAERPSVGHEVVYLAARAELASALASRHRGRDGQRMSLVSDRQRAALVSAYPDLASLVTRTGLPIEEWCAGLDDETRWLMAVELAFCDPFAPYEHNYRRADVYEALQNLWPRLGLPATAGTEVRRAVAQVPLPLPRWTALQAHGSPAMTCMAVLTSGIMAHSALRGRDLLGWVGWDAAGALYLVRDPAPTPATHAQSGDVPRSTVSLPLLEQGATTIAEQGRRVGPLHEVIAARHPSLKRSRTTPLRTQSAALEGHVPPGSVIGLGTADFLVALGPAWTRLELSRMCATVALFRARGLESRLPATHDMVTALDRTLPDLRDRLELETRSNAEGRGPSPQIAEIEGSVRQCLAWLQRLQ